MKEIILNYLILLITILMTILIFWDIYFNKDSIPTHEDHDVL